MIYNKDKIIFVLGQGQGLTKDDNQPGDYGNTFLFLGTDIFPAQSYVFWVLIR